jgi:putative tryptophan/tyrosine transport system substrate-binding protein
MMRRRDFITLLGTAAAWPPAARAQQPALPVIGYLGVGAPTASTLAALRKGLSEQGYVEGRNVAIEFRATERYDELAALAAELVRRQVAVICAFSTNAAQAAKGATTSVPIVFAVAGDPVRLGLVASLNRPGGYATGVTFLGSELVPKRLELLRELVPKPAAIAFLTNPANPNSEADVAEVRAAARTLGEQVIVLTASTIDEIDAAFTRAAERSIGALLIDVDVLFNKDPVSTRLVALAARYGVPTSHADRAAVAAGGLMSYLDDRADSLRQVGLYAGRILKGEKPADLPVMQPAKFDFVINLKTAKALGIEFPPSFHLRATEVIE